MSVLIKFLKRIILITLIVFILNPRSIFLVPKDFKKLLLEQFKKQLDVLDLQNKVEHKFFFTIMTSLFMVFFSYNNPVMGIFNLFDFLIDFSLWPFHWLLLLCGSIILLSSRSVVLIGNHIYDELCPYADLLVKSQPRQIKPS